MLIPGKINSYLRILFKRHFINPTINEKVSHSSIFFRDTSIFHTHFSNTVYLKHLLYLLFKNERRENVALHWKLRNEIRDSNESSTSFAKWMIK